jgi:hypothetical protein
MTINFDLPTKSAIFCGFFSVNFRVLKTRKYRSSLTYLRRTYTLQYNRYTSVPQNTRVSCRRHKPLPVAPATFLSLCRTWRHSPAGISGSIAGLVYLTTLIYKRILYDNGKMKFLKRKKVFWCTCCHEILLFMGIARPDAVEAVAEPLDARGTELVEIGYKILYVTINNQVSNAST